MTPEAAALRIREIAKLTYHTLKPEDVGCEMLELAPALVEHLDSLERGRRAALGLGSGPAVVAMPVVTPVFVHGSDEPVYGHRDAEGRLVFTCTCCQAQIYMDQMRVLATHAIVCKACDVTGPHKHGAER